MKKAEAAAQKAVEDTESSGGMSLMDDLAPMGGGGDGDLGPLADELDKVKNRMDGLISKADHQREIKALKSTLSKDLDRTNEKIDQVSSVLDRTNEKVDEVSCCLLAAAFRSATHLLTAACSRAGEWSANEECRTAVCRGQRGELGRCSGRFGAGQRRQAWDAWQEKEGLNATRLVSITITTVAASTALSIVQTHRISFGASALCPNRPSAATPALCSRTARPSCG